VSLALLAPLGLAALAALALPLWIHLVRRLELVRVEFAALRWISPRARPERRIRIQRPWLLLVRLLLLALLALLLAQPVWQRGGTRASAWIVLAPGVNPVGARAAVASDGEWHWLSPGFPALGTGAPPSAGASASLLRELDATLAKDTPLTVIVPERVEGLDGERPRLVRPVEWRVVPGRMPARPPGPALPRTLALRLAPDQAPSATYVEAAVAVWNLAAPGRYTLDAAPAGQAVPPTADWLVWLAPPAPALDRWLEQGGTALVVGAGPAAGASLWPDAHGRPLASASRQGAGRLVTLAGALAPHDLPALLDADFPQRLHAALAGPPPAPTAAGATALRPTLDPGMAGEALPPRHSVHSLDAWLVALIAATFLLERLIALGWRRSPR